MFKIGDDVRVDSFIGKIIRAELVNGRIEFTVSDEIRRCYNLSENNISELELPAE